MCYNIQRVYIHVRAYRRLTQENASVFVRARTRVRRKPGTGANRKGSHRSRIPPHTRAQIIEN